MPEKNLFLTDNLGKVELVFTAEGLVFRFSNQNSGAARRQKTPTQHTTISSLSINYNAIVCLK
ncbi:hypothetical protein D0907_20920 (plasmid) [Pseudoalteromonas lipolytica]|uniref:Uncharacterized protein n=1 Tax=Pseudoalteromonas lipolytica TaxID=570156 RepID=A0AAD0WEQ8_9GAMM|nr:hypothetical protein [Pseudoalteromonas donghaensis]AXV67793.1 hypothetical protein D0907_20920 [Pseudoalteromonas donghaensis]